MKRPPNRPWSTSNVRRNSQSSYAESILSSTVQQRTNKIFWHHSLSFPINKSSSPAYLWSWAGYRNNIRQPTFLRENPQIKEYTKHREAYSYVYKMSAFCSCLRLPGLRAAFGAAPAPTRGVQPRWSVPAALSVAV